MEQLPKIKTILSCAGIPIFGCCPFEPLRPQILECRAKERLPADAKSIFVALFPYAMEEAAYQGGNLSRYAAVGDYHEIVPQYLKRAVSALEQAFPEEAFVPFTDNSPIPEVRAAALAGLGRIGQNGLLIHERYGSWVFIGEIVTTKFERGMVPTGEQICEKQLFNLADRIEKVKVNEEEIAKYLPNISRKLGWLTEQDLIKRIVSLEFNRLIDYYRDTPDLDIPDENTRKPKEGNFAKEGRNGRKKDIRTAEAGFERIYINLGKAHGFFPPNLIEMVNSLVPGRVNIGRIDLLSSYSLFDVEKSSAQKVVGALKGNEFYGHRIYAELATDKDYSAPKGKRKGKEEGGRRTNEKRYGNSRRDHSESRSRRDRSSSKTKRSSYSSKKRK